MKRIYLDNAATTPIDKCVLKAMMPYLTTEYGNPSSVHQEGRKARLAIDKAREKIAELLGCYEDEIFFTSGASESNSWVSKNFKCECSPFSHDSMIMANKNVRRAQIMSYPLVDGEVGGKHYIYHDCLDCCHVDLTQAVGKEYINLHEQRTAVPLFSGSYAMRPLDKPIYKYATASFSGHKFGAPKGVGVLFIRRDLQENFKPLIYGHQEHELRGGTENVAGIVGMAKALELAYKNRYETEEKYSKLMNYIYSKLYFSGVKMSYHNNIMNITFNELDAQTAVGILDKEGVAVSAGSACNALSDEPSKILLAYGYSEEDAKKTIRVSLGKQNTLHEIKRFVKILKKIIDIYDKI